MSTRKRRRAKINENLIRDDDVSDVTEVAAVKRRLRGGGSKVKIDDEKGDDMGSAAIPDNDGFS